MGFLQKLFGQTKQKEMEQMENVKLAVIYYSSTGTNYQMAKWAEAGAKEAGAEVTVSYYTSPSPRDPLHDLVCRLLV
ncbi:hypothetical protein ACQ4LK_25730, partial [Bacillus pumilus]